MTDPGIFREIDGQPIVWTDDAGVVHRCEAGNAVPGDPDTRLVWTLCGRDVPAGAAHARAELVTCDACRRAAGDEPLKIRLKPPAW